MIFITMKDESITHYSIYDLLCVFFIYVHAIKNNNIYIYKTLRVNWCTSKFYD